MKRVLLFVVVLALIVGCIIGCRRRDVLTNRRAWSCGYAMSRCDHTSKGCEVVTDTCRGVAGAVRLRQ